MTNVPIFLLLLITTPSFCLIGYDCGGRHLNITTVSLLDSGSCDLDIKKANTTQAYIQLLQLSDYNHAEIIQCKAELTRTVFHCGMHSHISAVKHGQASYLEHIISDECNEMHRQGTWVVGTNHEKIYGIIVNNTILKSVTIAGNITPEGKCEGVSFTDAFGSWSNVIVQGTVKITLKSGYVPVHLTTGKIHLKSGTTCELKDGYCLDPDDGYTFWKPMPTSSCDFHQYDVLYEGLANRTRDETFKPAAPLVYSLETQDITFALTTTSHMPLCGYTLLRTEHPRLFILETTKANVPKAKSDVLVNNLDIFTYVNSKFVYVEKHIRSQMTSLYHNVIQHRCRLEKEIITNTLALATLLPDEFAYRLMKGPGYMAVTAGEAIHVLKCIPVEVMVRKTENCYIELPITVRNASLFLIPKSRILTKVGTQKECSRELPTLYHIEDTWVEFSPNAYVRHNKPQTLEPLTTITWNYLTPGPLASSGIYSKKDIEKLRDHIMFPAEKPAVLNSLARGITGYKTGGDTGSMYDFLDEQSLNRIAENTAKRIWSGFISFGSATAGVLGIFIIIRLVKIIIDTAIHGYALHTAYGCTLHLLGAIWSSLTHLLLHLAHKPPRRHNNDDGTNEGRSFCETSTLPPPIIHQPRSTAPPEDNNQDKIKGDDPLQSCPKSPKPVLSNFNLENTSFRNDYVTMQPISYKALSDRLNGIE